MLGFSPPCASAVWTRVWAEGVCTWEGMSPASRNRFCLQRAQGLWLGGSRRGAREWPQWASLGRGDPGQRPSTQWLRLCLGAAHFSGPRAYHWGLPCQDPPFKTICGICLAESARPAGLRAGAASPCSPAPRWTHQQRLPGVGGLLPPPALMASDSGSSEFCWENSLFKVFFFSPAWELLVPWWFHPRSGSICWMSPSYSLRPRSAGGNPFQLKSSSVVISMGFEEAWKVNTRLCSHLNKSFSFRFLRINLSPGQTCFKTFKNISHLGAFPPSPAWCHVCQQLPTWCGSNRL